MPNALHLLVPPPTLPPPSSAPLSILVFKVSIYIAWRCFNISSQPVVTLILPVGPYFKTMVPSFCSVHILYSYTKYLNSGKKTSVLFFEASWLNIFGKNNLFQLPTTIPPSPLPVYYRVRVRNNFVLDKNNLINNKWIWQTISIDYNVYQEEVVFWKGLTSNEWSSWVVGLFGLLILRFGRLWAGILTRLKVPEFLAPWSRQNRQKAVSCIHI